MHDPIDEWVMQALSEFDGVKLVSASSGELDIEGDKEENEKKKEKEEKKKENKDFLKRLGAILGKDNIESVDISDRLVDSPAVLTVDSGGMTAQMESMMKQMGQDVPASKKTLEVNPDHALIQSMKVEFGKDPKSTKLEEMTFFLRDQSILAE